MKNKTEYISECSCPCKVCILRGKHSPFKCGGKCYASPDTQDIIMKNCEEAVENETYAKYPKK